jgi:hypothetical protein
VRALTFVVFVLPVLAACPSSGASDGGTDAALDAPLACQADAGPVLDAGDAGDAGQQIQDMNPTQPPYQNACSAQQIADYAQCQGAKNTDLCKQFMAGATGEACGKCIETPFEIDGGTAVWGVIVFNGSTAFTNVEGCVNDALGTFDCGNSMHHLYQCEESVCGGCTGSDFGNCELESSMDPNYCRSFADAVNPCELEPPDAGCVQTSPCAPILGDAGIPCPASNCFPDASITDPTQQQVEWLQRIVTYMCGPVPDGGVNACP